MTDTALPTRCAHRDCAGDPLPESTICRGCAARLGQARRALPELYRRCGEFHHRTPAPAWEQSPSGGKPGPSVPLHAPAADARRAVETVLASWAGLTVQATGAPPPRRVVTDLCRFLLGRFAAMVRHPAAAELVSEVDDLLAEVDRVLRPGRGRPLGSCVVAGCEGTLTGSRDGEPLRVVCDASIEHEWTGPQVLALDGRRGAAAEPLWLNAAGITALWGIARGSVYRLASENGWGRRRQSGGTYYAAEDVRRTLA